MTEVTVSDDVLSISSSDGAFSVPNSLEAKGLFERGETADEDTTFIAASATDASFASLLIVDGEQLSAETFFGRTEDIETFPTGRAIFEGDYVGTIISQEGIERGSRITGQAALNVNFDKMTVAGFVDERTIPIPIFGTPLDFRLDTSLLFDQTEITDDGSFSGNVTVLRRNEDTGGSTIITGLGTFSGSLGGSDAEEAVGAVTFEPSDGEERSYEIGVFSVRQ